MWGLEPGDTGDIFDPRFLTGLLPDRGFEPSSEAAQAWLLAFCDATHTAAFTQADYGCALKAMHQWLVERIAAGDARCGGAAGLPVAPASFHPCVAEFLGECDWHTDSLRMYRGRLVAMHFWFQVGVRYESSYEELRDNVHKWEEWMGEQNAAAPAGVSRGYFTSGEFHCKRCELEHYSNLTRTCATARGGP